MYVLTSLRATEVVRTASSMPPQCKGTTVRNARCTKTATLPRDGGNPATLNRCVYHVGQFDDFAKNFTAMKHPETYAAPKTRERTQKEKAVLENEKAMREKERAAREKQKENMAREKARARAVLNLRSSKSPASAGTAHSSFAETSTERIILKKVGGPGSPVNVVESFSSTEHLVFANSTTTITARPPPPPKPRISDYSPSYKNGGRSAAATTGSSPVPKPATRSKEAPNQRDYEDMEELVRRLDIALGDK